MIKKPKVTRAIPGTVKPARDGVYQRNYSFRGDRPDWCYCSFQDGSWSFCATTPQQALRYRGTISGSQNLPWRGLAENPSPGAAPE